MPFSTASMPPVDSGSDGEAAEKPVRERLKQTTIAKPAGDVSREDEKTTLGSGRGEDSDVEITEDNNTEGTAHRKPTRKRSLEDVANADASTTLEKGNDDSKCIEGPIRKRTRDELENVTQRDAINGGSSDSDRARPKPDERSQSPQPKTHSLDMAQAVASPRKKRSRESFGADEETRVPKIQSTEENRARRSSSEERHPPEEAQRTEGTKFGAAGKIQSAAAPLFGTALKPKPFEKPSEAPQTSSSAFAASGFASLSGSSSPFGNLGAKASSSSQNSEKVNAAPLSSFASLGKSTSAFGSSFSSTPGGFGSSQKSSAFGSAGTQELGASAFPLASGPRLSSFASPVGDVNLGNKKPEKPFGAPAESEDSSNSGSDSESAGGEEAPFKEEESTPKFQAQEGEDNEDSVFVNRGKLFQFHADSASWKERGVGPMKVNVERTANSNEQDSDIETKKEPPKKPNTVHVKARFVMRNHATHKVILNAPIFKEMNMNEQGTKQLQFICLNEAGKMTNYMLRMAKEEDVKQLHQVVKDLQGKM